ncbi:MAG: hypothetical protein AB1297_08785, partial [bacterium]
VEEVKQEEKPARPVYVEVEKPKYETYQYFDMGRRDPFVPLKRIGVSKTPSKGETEVVIEEEIKIEETGMEGWEISGLIWDKEEKIALIKTQEENYLLSKGAIFDRDGNPVSEIKAKLKGDEIILSKKGKEISLKMEEKSIKEENIVE